jgi:hypothetical protein
LSPYAPQMTASTTALTLAQLHPHRTTKTAANATFSSSTFSRRFDGAQTLFGDDAALCETSESRRRVWPCRVGILALGEPRSTSSSDWFEIRELEGEKVSSLRPTAACERPQTVRYPHLHSLTTHLHPLAPSPNLSRLPTSPHQIGRRPRRERGALTGTMLEDIGRPRANLALPTSLTPTTFDELLTQLDLAFYPPPSPGFRARWGILVGLTVLCVSYLPASSPERADPFLARCSLLFPSCDLQSTATSSSASLTSHNTSTAVRSDRGGRVCGSCGE